MGTLSGAGWSCHSRRRRYRCRLSCLESISTVELCRTIRLSARRSTAQHREARPMGAAQGLKTAARSAHPTFEDDPVSGRGAGSVLMQCGRSAGGTGCERITRGACWKEPPLSARVDQRHHA